MSVFLAHAVQNDAASSRGSIADAHSPIQCFESTRNTPLIVGVQGEERVSLAHEFPRLGVNFNSRSRLHRIVFDCTARAQPPRGHAHAECIHFGNKAIGLGSDRVG